MTTKRNPTAGKNKIDDSARREFLHKAAKAGVVTTGSVALLMAAQNKRARAQCGVGSDCPPCCPPCPSK